MLDGLAIDRDRPVCDPDEDLLPRDVLDLIEHRWWRPIAVRRAERNSTVIAHADVMVVMIPSAVYVAEWFKPHTAEALAHLLRTGTAT